MFKGDFHGKKSIFAGIVCTLFAKARNLALAKSSIPVET